MVQLRGSGLRATSKSPPCHFAATSDHRDDASDHGYVSLNHHGGGYSSDEGNPSDEWVDEDSDTLPPLATSNKPRSSALQPMPLPKRRKGSRTPTAGRRALRASTYSPPLQYAQSRTAPDSSGRTESRQHTPSPGPAFPAPESPPPSPPPPAAELPALRAASIVRPAAPYAITIILFLLLVVSSTLSNALLPLCHIPGLGFLPVCNFDVHGKGGAKVMWADYPGLVAVQSRMFEELIDNTIASPSGSLTLNIKKTELTTTDLITLVKFSDLHSKHSLSEALSEFVHEAKIAGRYLQRLDSKIYGALDSIISINDLALNAIDSARVNEPGIFGSFMTWKPSRKAIDEVVEETFRDAMHVMSTQLERLILESESNYANLDNLEEKLFTINGILARENKTVSDALDDLSESSWTSVGFNDKELQGFQRSLKLLHDLALERKEASKHVGAALHSLRSAGQYLEGLREQAALLNLGGHKIALEAHMESLKKGLEDLRKARSRAKKIETAALKRAFRV